MSPPAIAPATSTAPIETHQRMSGPPVDKCRRFEVPAPVAANSYQELQIEKRHLKDRVTVVPLLFPKFVSEVAAGDHELRKRGTSNAMVTRKPAFEKREHRSWLHIRVSGPQVIGVQDGEMPASISPMLRFSFCAFAAGLARGRPVHDLSPIRLRAFWNRLLVQYSHLSKRGFHVSDWHYVLITVDRCKWRNG
jgi:hypothetical protein